MRGNEAVSTAGNIAVSTMPIAGSVRTPRSERALSRRVAMDIVGFLDVFGVLIGGLVPAAIYASFGELSIRWPLITQTGLLASLFAYLCLRHFELYDINRIGDLPLRPLRILAALAIAFAVVMGLSIPFGISEMHFWVWYGTWAIVSTTLVMATRICAHRVLNRLTAAGAFDARIAVYGNGTIAERLANHLTNPTLAVRFVGVFDDRTDKGRNPSTSSASQLQVTGGLVDLIALGRTGDIDQIIIALPPSADRRTADVARRLEQLPVSLHVCTHLVSDLIDSTTAHHVSHLGPIGLLDIKTKPLSDWGRHVKAIEDYAVASLALIVAAPVMVLVAVAIKLDSPGPIFFRQRRHGLNRRVIEVLKFRSMRVMEDGADVKQATADDPRVTRIGRFLRASSLDELPQLINVLRGEMSLIGPRPHALVHDDHYGEMLERYANRHQVKPGMTGWAQVNGFRGPTETHDKMRARVEADLYYIDNWSLWLDLRILVLTVFVGLHHKNAL